MSCKSTKLWRGLAKTPVSFRSASFHSNCIYRSGLISAKTSVSFRSDKVSTAIAFIGAVWYVQPQAVTYGGTQRPDDHTSLQACKIAIDPRWCIQRDYICWSCVCCYADWNQNTPGGSSYINVQLGSCIPSPSWSLSQTCFCLDLSRCIVTQLEMVWRWTFLRQEIFSSLWGRAVGHCKKLLY